MYPPHTQLDLTFYPTFLIPPRALLNCATSILFTLGPSKSPRLYPRFLIPALSNTSESSIGDIYY